MFVKYFECLVLCVVFTPFGIHFFSMNVPDEEPQMEETEEPVVCWESLADLDCKEKVSFISSSSLNGDLIQSGVQEV